jgi:hypothetical protein
MIEIRRHRVHYQVASRGVEGQSAAKAVTAPSAPGIDRLDAELLFP